MARKPGTYDAVMPGLKPLPPDDAARQDRIERAKAEIADRGAAALASAYVRLRKRKEEIAAALSALEIRINAHEQLLAASQESHAEGWGQFGVKDNALRLPGGETVRVHKEPYGKVVDKEAFRLWCMAPADRCMTCGGSPDALGHLETDEQDEQRPFERHAFKPGGGYERQLQLWPSTMNGVVKERLLAGEEPPDGTEAFSYTKVVYVKAGAE
jgi:hypothetical protein